MLAEDAGAPDRGRARLEALLDRIEARRKSRPDSPGLEPFAQSIRLKLGEQLWKDSKLAEARRLWDDVFAPMRRLPADDRGRKAMLARFAPAMRRISRLYFESGLWERAAEYDTAYRAGDPAGRSFQCYDSGVLALACGDVAAYREIASEAVDRAAGRDDFWTSTNALRTATLGSESPVAPERLVEKARSVSDRNRNDGWYRVVLGDALSRAGRDEEALAALGPECNTLNGKAVVARIHARAGRAERARRWLRALERHVEEHVRWGLLSLGALRAPQYWMADVLRADLLRREAYAALGETAPELRNLRLLRADTFWRLGERDKAETELAAAVARAPTRWPRWSTAPARSRPWACAIAPMPTWPRRRGGARTTRGPGSCAGGCSRSAGTAREPTPLMPARPGSPRAGSIRSSRPAGGSPGRIPRT